MPSVRGLLQRVLVGHRMPRAEFAPPPPSNPVELGLSLRVQREALGLSLEQVRDETGVPRLDLECLERGQLDPFHLEAAAVVAVFRYAQVLQLEPDPLARIIREYWPRTATGIEALGAIGPGPVADLHAADEAFGRLTEGRKAIKKSTPKLGLTKATRNDLKLRDLSANATIAELVVAHRSALPELAPGEADLDEEDEERPPETAALAALGSPSDEDEDAEEESGRFGRLAQVVAERFGVEDEEAAAGEEPSAE